MDQHRFFNACMSLMNLDMHELVDAGIIKAGNLDHGGTSWKRFNDEPLMFLAKIDDAKRDALWKLLEVRQIAKDPKPGLVAFAKEMIRLAWEGCDNSDIIQEAALKHGLLVETVFDPAKHSDPIGCAEEGCRWFIFAEPLA